MNTAILETLTTHFTRLGLKSAIQPRTPEVPVDQLVVVLSEAEKIAACIVLLPQVQSPPILQIVIELPLRAQHAHLGSTSRLLCAINARLPLKGFELNEAQDNTLLFRMLIPGCGDSWRPERIVEAMGLAIGLISRFTPCILGAATGRQDYRTAHASMLAAVQAQPDLPTQP